MNSIRNFIVKYDLYLFLLILCLFIYAYFAAIFNRPEWGDWVIYALPGANYVSGRGFNLVQIGQQYAFDQTWRINSPLMGVFPILPYKLFGISSTSYLSLILLFAMLMIGLFTRLVIKLTHLTKTESVIIAVAFLANRHIYNELYNQRYSVLGFSCILLLFSPNHFFSSKKTAYIVKSWAFAFLPIIHPAMFIAWGMSIVFLIFNSKIIKELSLKDIIIYLFPILLLGIYSLVWYFEPTYFQLQFMPHLKSLSNLGRAILFKQTTWPINNIPTYLILFWIIGISFYYFFKKISLKQFTNYELFISTTIILVLAYDLLKGFRYGMIYIYPLGIILSVYLINYNKNLKYVLIFIGLLNIPLAIKSEVFNSLYFDSYHKQLNFILQNSKPGDKIILGAPFILASSQILSDREIVGVLPNNIGLPFDKGKFIGQLNSKSNVFIGNKVHFNHPLMPIWEELNLKNFPLYNKFANERMVIYNGIEISIIRK